MSGALSKRQQARNERALQELIKTVPGNNVCADCQARNPGWASWSLGIFLCMRCAALHRKLGTHITKVKSLSMDSWSTDQVENMKRVGNVTSNRLYNPDNTRPPVPFDADEADSAMERFIRAKYQERAVSAQARQNTGSTGSDDQPPPLPPKPGSRFGFRSASSIFPLSSKARREAAAAAARPDSRERSPSPPRRNKPSRVFGTEVGPGGSDDLDSKMAKLRDMGFRDDRRNITVLKGLSGNLERTVETLARLEGGGNGILRSGDNSGPSSRSRTPITPTAGITIDRTRGKSPQTSNNPFDMLDKPAPAPPQSSQSTGSLAQSQMGNNPYQQAPNSNPYGLMPSQSQYSLNQAFQSMAVSSQPSQPLFPNHTGGFPGPQPPQFHQLHQQSMTPPVPSIPQQYYPPVIYENQSQQPQQNYNPFMQQQQQQQQPQQARQAPPINTNFQSNPYARQQPTPQATPVNTNFQSNPFGQMQGMTNQGYVQSPMEQPQASFYDNGASQQQQQQNPLFQNNNQQQLPQKIPQQAHQQFSQQSQQQQQQNPFFQNNNQQQVPQQTSQQMPQQSFNYQAPPQAQGQQYQQFRGQTHPLVPQQTGRADKRSILDLYNQPQLAPTPMQPQQQLQDQGQNRPAPVLDTQQQQRSVSSPLSAPPMSGNRNPFMISGGGGGGGVQSAGAGVDSVGSMPVFSPNQNGARHASQESMDVGGWQSGRHSPDAWGTISARSMR